MQNVNYKIKCESSDSMLAYLYGELSPAERDRFEAHLPECFACTDEFAAVADSRYSVYEWKKLEFEPLETPIFQIPYHEARPSFGWFEAFKAVFATGPKLASAGAFAIIAAFAGIIFVNGTFTTGDIAYVPPVETTDRATASVSAPLQADDIEAPLTPTEPNDNDIDRSIDDASSKTEAEPRRVVRKNVPRRTAPVKASVAGRNAPSALEDVRVPRLNEFEDISDDSLRLADLVAEIGSSND